MKSRIKKICKRIEKEHDVKILFAVENGSRAWKMHSKDSDYDVRFVFARKLEEYVQIKQPKDVIEAGFDSKGKPCKKEGALIDMCGFDIFKYLKLLSSSNPTTIEWLMSDIVYHGKQNKAFKRFAKKHFSKKALYMHYKSMCKNNYLKYLKSGNMVTYKKYLYAYRGLVNAKWIEHKGTIPPMVFSEAVNRMKGILPERILNKLNNIIKLKAEGMEKDIIENIVEMDRHIENFLKERDEVESGEKPPLEKLNKQLRKILIK